MQRLHPWRRAMSLTAEQIAERHSGIGGSDAAPCLGLSPFKSALELFLDKRERREPSPIELSEFRWGNLLEPVIRQEYSEKTGRIVRMPSGTLHHPKHSFMIAHVDGVTDDSRVFEAKTARSADGWGQEGTDDVPHHYLLQVQHYLAVTGFAVADVAVLIGGNDFRMYEVPADSDLQGMIIDGEAEFWQRLKDGVPPAPDFDRSDAADIMRRLYPGTDGRSILADDDARHHRIVMQNAQEMVSNYTKLAESARAHLLHQMGDASVLVFPDAGVQLRRKLIQRKGYAVAPSSHIDARFTKIKEVVNG